MSEKTSGHVCALVTILIWGTTFISTKVLLDTLTPLEILFGRFLLGYLALLMVRPRMLRPGGLRRELLFAAAGLCGVTLYFLLENLDLTHTLASNVGVVVSVSPVFTALLAHLFLDGERLTARFFAGFAAAMGGICLVTFHGADLRLEPLGDMLALLAAAVWAAWAVLAPLYAWWHFALAAAVSAAAWLGGRKLFPDKVLILPDPEPAPEPEPEHAAPEDPLAVERARALAELRRLDENIEDAKLSAQIVHMEEVTGKIFDIVAGQPAKLPQLRRFLNYYLPTTLKLLNAYDRMGAAGVEGANIDGTMGRIDAMMDKVVEAFDKQLDALFADEALDISTDITVLEQMLAQEGLGGMQMGQS